jgi:hypothetical protein
MPASSYRFVSPGVFINEIDQSQLTAISNQTGPTVIGRFQKGPTMRPVYINSVSDLLEIFGNPIPGGSGQDVWRDGNSIGPTYAAFAAQAWLRNTPALNVIRLVGKHHTNATNDAKAKAGWDLGTNLYQSSDSSAGAYGLFLIPSASSATTPVTGTLAAVFYATEASVYLSGNLAGDLTTLVSGTNVLVKSVGSYAEFTLMVNDGTTTYKTNFNLNKDSNKYIRTVLNTNPILTNNEITSPSNLEKYWLGESYERSVDEIFTSNGYSTWTSSDNVYGFIAPLKSNTAGISLDKQRSQSRPAKTGWVIAQDLSTDTASFTPESQQKLFRIVALDSGEFEQKNYKVSIRDITPPATDFDDYGTFTVEVRQASDTDNLTQVIEVFNNLNLNPASENYIGKQIGDSYVEWSDTEKVLKQYGTYNNRSSYIRVEVDADLDNGLLDPTYLPFGFFGPPRFKRFQLSSSINGVPKAQLPVAPVSCSAARAYDSTKFLVSSASITASMIFPSIPLRNAAYDGGLINVTDAYFGIAVGERAATTTFDKSYYDLTRAATSYIADENYDWYNQSYGEPSFVFTLDDVSGSSGANEGYIYLSGSRKSGTSITAVNVGSTGSNAGYRSILNADYNKFTMPLYNGFDGFDVTESEPLRNSFMEDASTTELNNYVYYTYNRAINTVSDPETLVTDIIAIPGLTNSNLTTKLIRTCESRADALAVIDLPEVYKPEGEGYVSNNANRFQGTAKGVVADLKARSLNSSYGATYYPWVQINPATEGGSSLLWVPPSVVALGAMSYGQATQELWFAPAGFTRGGLSEGRAGVAVTRVSHRLTSKDRDTLYEGNINPIAQFPAEGIVIFGQKTLQVTPSALDRINVRRMLIYVKREISRIAATLLFDQNVDATWARFTGQVNPFLASIKSRLGLTDYRVILDSTTTTPDLVDRNILYAKVFLKPARAIEFIAIDFTITDSGASFAD